MLLINVGIKWHNTNFEAFFSSSGLSAYLNDGNDSISKKENYY